MIVAGNISKYFLSYRNLHYNMKEMVGGCCVCSDERGWAENPLVYCDGHGCNVAVHQGKFVIVLVPNVFAGIRIFVTVFGFFYFF